MTHMPRKCGIRVCGNGTHRASLKEEGRRKEPKGPEPTSWSMCGQRQEVWPETKCRAFS